MSAKNKKLLAVLGAAAVVVIVIAAVLLGKGGQTTTVDPASTPRMYLPRMWIAAIPGQQLQRTAGSGAGHL